MHGRPDRELAYSAIYDLVLINHSFLYVASKDFKIERLKSLTERFYI